MVGPVETITAYAPPRAFLPAHVLVADANETQAELHQDLPSGYVAMDPANGQVLNPVQNTIRAESVQKHVAGEREREWRKHVPLRCQRNTQIELELEDVAAVVDRRRFLADLATHAKERGAWPRDMVSYRRNENKSVDNVSNLGRKIQEGELCRVWLWFQLLGALARLDREYGQIC